MKAKDSTVLWIIVIVGAFLVLSGTIKLPSAPSSISTNPAPVAGSVACTPSGNSHYPQAQLLASYPDPTNNGKVTQAAVPYNAVVNGQTVVAAAGGTSATAVTFVNGTLPCGLPVTIFYGAWDGGSYYVHPVGGITTSTSVSIFDTAAQKFTGLASVQFSNQTTFGVDGHSATGITGGKLYSAGGLAGPFTMTLNTGAGQFGENGTVITLVFNALAGNPYVTSASGVRLPSISYTVPAAANVVTNLAAVSFLAPPLTNWNTAYTFQISDQLTSAYATNTPIEVYVTDQKLFFQNGVATPQVINPNTGATFGATAYIASNSADGFGFEGNVMALQPIKLCKYAGCV